MNGTGQGPSVLTPSDTPKEVAIAESLLPWRKDDNRAKYFGYLACGFTTEEALYMLGLKLSWLEEQRQSSDFSSFELRVPEIRKELSREYIELDFFRNFMLVLEKDYRVLKQALEADIEGTGVIPQQAHQYLLKLRSAYTPQQLQILEQAMRGVGEAGFNFAKFVKDNQEVIELSRTDTIRLKRTNEKESNNSPTGSSLQTEH